jgi:MYXO-CTERM domain-containing protein
MFVVGTFTTLELRAFFGKLQDLSRAYQAENLALASNLDVFVKALGPDPPVTLPSIQATGLITPALATQLQDIGSRNIALVLAAGDFKDAVLAFGQAGDSVRSNLLTQMAVTQATLRNLFLEQAAAYAALKDSLKGMGVADILGGSGEAFLSALRQNGFPADEQTILQQLGLSASDIAQLKDDLLALGSGSDPTSLFAALDAAVQVDNGIASDLAATPEPTTLLLWGTAMAGLGLAARWRRRRQN